MKLPVSVVVLTLNEEFHLPNFLGHLSERVEEVFVVDSLSTDRSVSIALKHGARVVQRPFTNFGNQWNFALKYLPIASPWTIKLDPDERISDELFESIAAAISEPGRCSGFRFMRRLWFFGRPLHVHAPVDRVWKTGSCRFSDVIVNEHPLIDGEVRTLRGLLEHHDSADFHAWIDKQNRYSTMEAISMVKDTTLSVEPRLIGNSLERRMFLKKYFFKLPFRYQLQFLHEYLCRKSFLDGRAGLEWSRLRVQIRRWREIKAVEMRMTGRIPDVPKAPRGDYDSRIRNTDLQKQVEEAAGAEF